MPTSRPRRAERAQRARLALDAEQMVRLARTLAALDESAGDPVPLPAPPRTPELIWVLRTEPGPAAGAGAATPSPGARPLGTLARSPLPADEPVLALYGRVAPPEVDAVGFVGAGRARSHDDGAVRGEGSFVHLLRRDGVAVTVVPGVDGRAARVFGPSHQPEVGRIPDACRRMLGLPSAPAPSHTVDHWLDLWLELLVLLALRRPGLRWAELNDEVTAPFLRFPGAPTDLRRVRTPAQVARVLVALGHAITWSELREVHLHGVGGDAASAGAARWGSRGLDPTDRSTLAPLADHATTSWMDDGMYARAWLGEQLPCGAVLEILQQQLPATVLDQVVAAISLTFAQVPGRDAA